VDRQHLASSGYSLIELSVALFMIAGAAIMISQFSTTYNNPNASLRRSCEGYTESLVGLIREQTPFQEVTKVLPNWDASSSTSTLAPAFSKDSRALEASLYNDGSIRYMINYDPNTSDNQGPYIQNFQQIQGSIRTLSEMYNRYPALRCQFANYARLDPSNNNSLPVPSEFLKLPSGGNTNVQFRIEPFNIDTGVAFCQNAAWARPQGLRGVDQNVYVPGSGSSSASSTIENFYKSHTETAYNYYYGGYHTAGTSYDSSQYTNGPIGTSTMGSIQKLGSVNVGDLKIGFRFSAKMTYELKDETYSCSSTEEFVYPTDYAQPAVPDLARVTSIDPPQATTAIWDRCSDPSLSDGKASVQLGYSSAIDPEPGTQFVCKDMSWIREPIAHDDGGPAQIKCMTSAGALPQPYYSDVLHMNENNDASNIQFPFNVDDSLRNKDWVACDHLMQCGKLPQTPVTKVTSGGFNYTLEYRKLPVGCHLNFEVVAVDTAGNRSVPAASGFLQGELAQSATSSDGYNPPFKSRNNEIYYPTCGNTPTPYYKTGLGYYCPPDASWSASDTGLYPYGYYTCRAGGCCTGPTCTPNSL
jgi:hypothetical protein